MGDSGDKENQHTDDISRLPALFKEWQGLVVALGGAVATALAVLLPGQTPAAVQVIGYTVALALVVVSCLIFVRVRRRQQTRKLREKRRETWEREAAGAHRTAFRGLFPYQEGDELPGEHRRLEARRLVTQFSEPTFSFGVVCGDSGCGKTSLLRSAIQSRLKTAGEERDFNVLYLSNPRELADDGAPHADATDIATRLRRESERLRRLTDGAAQGRSLILIIDQFEEFFIEYSSPELRLELGKLLNGFIKSSPPVRILCAIRRDYLADMKDLAPPSPAAADRNFFEPISLQTLFTLKNFTVEQAAKIIKECAERDRVEVEEEFAETLASDLGEGGFVRPPELQIVCTALVGNLTTAEYRLAGGARGILSHYIEDAINVSGDPAVGRRVLRALCDFPAHAKRNPQTVADIAEAVGVEGAQASATIHTALRQFEVARLVVVEKRDEDEPTYALIHDYLVDAVSKATSDVSTRDEEANQLLDYYVSEYRTDPKTRIPYRRLRFIRKYADRKKLAENIARRLVRASMMRLVTSAVALSALVVVATASLVALTTTRRDWLPQPLASHWEGNASGRISRFTHPKGDLLVTGLDRGGKAAKLWDVKTARFLRSLKGESFRYIPPDYVLSVSKDDPFVNAFHLPTGRESKTALAVAEANALIDSFAGRVSFNQHGTIIALRGDDDSFAEDEQRRQPPPAVKVFSIADNKFIGETTTCHTGGRVSYDISDDGAYYIILCNEKDNVWPTVFNVQRPGKVTLARPGHTLVGWHDVDALGFRVASLEESADGRRSLVLWDFRTGTVIDQSNLHLQLDPNGDIDEVRASFTPGGSFVYVTYGDRFRAAREQGFALFRAGGLLQRVAEVPEAGVRVMHVVDRTGDAIIRNRIVLGWPNGAGGTYLWDLTEAGPRLLPDLELPENINVVPLISLDPAGMRALLTLKEKGRIDLWDLKEGKKLKTLDVPGRFINAEFTIGGNAVAVNIEGGTVSLFRADNGEKVTDNIRNVGGSDREIFYDEKCRRAHVWTDEGRVLRYTYGWYLFGQESWFWPAEKCEVQ